MNTLDVCRYGQFTFLGAVDGVRDDGWTIPGACGVWSIKHLVSHLASYEAVIADIIESVAGATTTPALERFKRLGNEFNDIAVQEREHFSPERALQELTEEHERAMTALTALDAGLVTMAGTIPWYGPEYALDDLLVYMGYGHKREHAGQIGVFRSRIAA